LGFWEFSFFLLTSVFMNVSGLIFSAKMRIKSTIPVHNNDEKTGQFKDLIFKVCYLFVSYSYSLVDWRGSNRRWPASDAIFDWTSELQRSRTVLQEQRRSHRSRDSRRQIWSWEEILVAFIFLDFMHSPHKLYVYSDIYCRQFSKIIYHFVSWTNDCLYLCNYSDRSLVRKSDEDPAVGCTIARAFWPIDRIRTE
jgi:hypothetical protein